MSIKWYAIVMGDDNCISKSLITNNSILCYVDAYALEIGLVNKSWKPNAILFSNDEQYDGAPDDMLANSLGLPVFSQRLRSALAQSNVGNQDMQHLPIRVALSTGNEIHGFTITNVITRIPALDPEHSKMLEVDENELDPLTGRPKVISVWTASLKSNLLNGHDVIRLVEFFPPIFVSHRFVTVFRAGGFTGATFSPVPVA